ncbi:MAG: flagellar basal body L-ring protein FlgH [Candidatus Eiseniibacteriota bacterium]
MNGIFNRRTLALAIALTLLGSQRAQAAKPAAAGGKAGAAASATPAQPSAPVPAPRAGWLSDSRPLHPGDLLTVVVDERTQANETVSHIANNDHSMKADLNAGLTDTDVRLGPSKSINGGLNMDSRSQGSTGRSGDLTAVMTVSVVSVNAAGIATIHGSRQVKVDGRLQDITLAGTLRQQDVGPGNIVASSRIADAEVTYNGKRINPRVGFITNILGLVWP